MVTKKDDIIVAALERISEATSEIHSEMVAMRESVSSLQTISTKQQGILETHIRRTEIAEAAIKQTALEAAKNREDLDRRVIPLEAHVSMWAGAGKLLAVVVMLVAAGAGIWKLFLH